METTINEKRAREIMGKNFFGIEEWSSLYEVNFSNKQLREVAEFPWSEDILNTPCPFYKPPCPFYKGKKVKETHFAFLGLNAFKGKLLSIIKWQKLHPDSSQPRFHSYAPDRWYIREKFANKLSCGFRWYLMPLKVLPDSVDKVYQEQVAMLGSNYEVPLAIEEISKNILYYQRNGTYINQKNYGRCRCSLSRGTRGIRVVIGTLQIDYYEDRAVRKIGIVASRKQLS